MDELHQSKRGRNYKWKVLIVAMIGTFHGHPGFQYRERVHPGDQGELRFQQYRHPVDPDGLHAEFRCIDAADGMAARPYRLQVPVSVGSRVVHRRFSPMRNGLEPAFAHRRPG